MNFVSKDNMANLMTSIGEKIDHVIFEGTRAKWEALTTEEKAKYETIHLLENPSSDTIVTDAVVAGDMNPVTSNAVAEAIAGIGSGAGTSGSSKYVYKRLINVMYGNSTDGSQQTVTIPAGTKFLRINVEKIGEIGPDFFVPFPIEIANLAEDDIDIGGDKGQAKYYSFTPYTGKIVTIRIANSSTGVQCTFAMSNTFTDNYYGSLDVFVEQPTP